MPKQTLKHLQELQALPLNIKIGLTRNRLREWVREFGTDGVYVSFSGGKDSTVLLHLVRELYPDIPAVFCDTGLEYPEIRQFVKTFDNVVWLKPKKNFFQVCEEYGFPLISKEVSECVYGARKYLTSILEQESLDRQTDRQTDRTVTDTSVCVDLENSVNFPNPPQKLRGGYHRNKSGALSNTQKITDSEVVEQSETLQTLLESAPQIIKSIPDFGVAIDNFRVQRLLGILPTEGKATMETIPSTKDRSMFSCVRYQFFLDAPFEISQKCCGIMKKEPFARYHRETGRVPFTAQMASESRLRTQIWLKNGCNAFEATKQMSNPMSFWTEQDVLLYIYQNKISIASVYGEIVKENEVEGQLDMEDLGIFDLGRPTLKTTGCTRTGCVLCGYGAHREKAGEGRFERLKETHPNMYKALDRATNSGVTMREAIDWTNEHGNLNIRY